ncbi:MAG TPA: ATP-binding protein [Polyangiaceae bacterium]|nr:ATP-binding protein [Polyangiaceae bacterium]
MAAKTVVAWFGRVVLEQRFAGITAVRLVTLMILLVSLVLLDERGGVNIGWFSVQTGLITLSIAFALTAVFAIFLRLRRGLKTIVYAQLITDQMLWTVVVYLSGGAASGATSLYGLSCLIGAILAEFRGAAIAGVAGAASFIALLWGLKQGFIPPPLDQPQDLYQYSRQELIYSVVANLLVIMVIGLLAGNLTERLRLAGGRAVAAEERAERAERMAALGRLATGLAHEIRNPLGSISGSIQLLKESRLSSEDRQLCGIIQREAGRLNDLVTDMIDFARPRVPERSVVDVVATAAEVVKLAGQSGRGVSDVGIVMQHSDADARVLADGAQLRQLIWNLVRNAVQASDPGSQVIVSVRKNGKGEVELVVADNGVGLSPEAKQHIFDAFFTTRSQGTGLGLAVVKRIADNHGFPINVESNVGGGATFRIGMGKPRAEAVGFQPEGEPARTTDPPNSR